MSASFDTLLVPYSHPTPDDLSRAFFCAGVSASIAAAGSAQGSATALTNRTNQVTAADGAKGVIVPSTDELYSTRFVFNDSASTLLLYPPSGCKFNRGSTNAAVSVAAGVVVFVYRMSSTVFLLGGVATLTGVLAGSASVGTDLDVGSSGTAGTVDIFPATASKGKLQIAPADNTGDTTTTLTNAAQATTRTYTIPDALANADVLLGAQAAVARTATADGTTTGTIAAKGRFQHITVTAGGDANSIIILPTPTPGTQIVLHVGATGFELRSSDPATIAINGGTGASAESAIPANSTVFMTCVSATAWKGYYMDADGDLAKVEAAA